ncbi:MAG TPA: NADH-quinone oxidoreductase subunit C, partial [Acidobacteriota bacterium]|nr:NADH-quinone oxidoreductase subunit C [Acidobacteriota bacterium]
QMFRQTIIERVEKKRERVSSMFASSTKEANRVQMFAILANDAKGTIYIIRTFLENDVFESITPLVPQAHLFEREIAEQYGVQIEGHPWLKPVRFHSYDMRKTASKVDSDGPAVMNFFDVKGEQVHEVAVGPVHAGVIEPGHFRFHCNGEEVFYLEIALGYQHRGSERVLIDGPHLRTMYQMETIAGDTTIGHSLAYCQALEALSGTPVSTRAQSIRGIALELERLANHVGDLGALAGDVAYLPTASFCGRLRGEFLNMTAEICGSRFGRGLIRPGGAGFNLTAEKIKALEKRLSVALREVTEAVNLLWDTPTVVERFESTGHVSLEDAEMIGMVGPAARACGLARDVRHDYPAGIYRFVHVPVMIAHHGDVNSRAFVRRLEIQQSIQFILHQLQNLPDTTVRNDARALAADSISVSLVEGWRGEICHIAVTDATGHFSRYKITDPSFHNWFGLSLALRNQQISDFPLCNKSFNLSYCGHDL